MRAVDTNILTRYFRQDDSRQSPAALRVMAGRLKSRSRLPKAIGGEVLPR